MDGAPEVWACFMYGPRRRWASASVKFGQGHLVLRGTGDAAWFCRLDGLAAIRGAMTCCQQPLKDMKSPSGFGRVGVKGSNGKDCDVSKPAALAALKSTKGMSAFNA